MVIRYKLEDLNTNGNILFQGYSWNAADSTEKI